MSQRMNVDDQLHFLLMCVKWSNNGKVDFWEVAKECGVVSKGAAAKRYERMLKSHGINPHGGGTWESSMSPGQKQAMIARPVKKRKLDDDIGYSTFLDGGSDSSPPIKKPQPEMQYRLKQEQPPFPQQITFPNYPYHPMIPQHFQHVPQHLQTFMPSSPNTMPPFTGLQQPYPSSNTSQHIASLSNLYQHSRFPIQSQWMAPVPPAYNADAVDNFSNASFPSHDSLDHLLTGNHLFTNDNDAAEVAQITPTGDQTLFQAIKAEPTEVKSDPSASMERLPTEVKGLAKDEHSEPEYSTIGLQPSPSTRQNAEVQQGPAESVTVRLDAQVSVKPETDDECMLISD